MQLLTRMELKADTIARVAGIPEQEVHEYIDAEIEALERIEKDYYAVEWPKVQKAIKEMEKDVPEHERHEMRRRFLLERIQELKPKYLENPTDDLRKELNSLLFEVKVYTGETEGFSPVDIARARQFPITRLIQNHNNMAKCPFHKDNSPSLNLKNNFYYCHGCGAHGDVIDFVMKRDDLSFRQAIMKLHS